MAAEWQKPPDWLDEERMNFLSAPLPSQRTDKPSQWDTQTKFWSDLIVSSCSDCCQVSILGRHVEERFTRSGRTPACLAGVVEDACKQGVLRSAKSWEKNDCSESWLEWGVNLASSWLTGSPERPESWLEVTYVIPKLVEVNQYCGRVCAELHTSSRYYMYIHCTCSIVHASGPGSCTQLPSGLRTTSDLV